MRLLLAGLVLFCLPACGARTELAEPTYVPLPTERVVYAGPATAIVDDAKPCVAGTFALDRAHPKVLFVIDRSGSMAQGLDSTQKPPSRWVTLRDSLKTVLPEVESTVELGALFFPASDSFGQAARCSVPTTVDLAPALNQAQALLATFFSTGPGGFTPTYDALRVAHTFLESTRAASTARTLVLATDGGPNCNPGLDTTTCVCVAGKATAAGCLGSFGGGGSDSCLDDARTVAEVGALRISGIPTYVIGLGDEVQNEYGPVLDAMADAGGRPRSGADGRRYYGASSPAELTAAVETIREQVTRCTFLTPSVPDRPDGIQVRIDGMAVVEDSTGQDGWSFADKPNGEIALHGAACDQAATTGAIVEATVECADP
jgi:hypothetical protein